MALTCHEIKHNADFMTCRLKLDQTSFKSEHFQTSWLTSPLLVWNFNHHVPKNIYWETCGFSWIRKCRDPGFPHSPQRCVQLTAGPTGCVWAEHVAARRAGPAQAATSACATRSASNTGPAKTESASATRAGTESTAPSVSSPVCAHVRVCGWCTFDVCACVCVSARGCAQKHQHQVRLKWQLFPTLLKEFGNKEWRQKGRPWGIEERGWSRRWASREERSKLLRVGGGTIPKEQGLSVFRSPLKCRAQES